MPAHIRKEVSNEQIAVATAMFKLVSDPTRLKMTVVITARRTFSWRAWDEVGMQPSVVSQHLAKLRISHMVSMRREGTKIFYKAENEHVLHLIEHAFTQADHIRGGEHE